MIRSLLKTAVRIAQPQMLPIQCLIPFGGVRYSFTRSNTHLTIKKIEAGLSLESVEEMFSEI